MVERSVESSWAHFEVVAEGGWFKNLLHGRRPWVEVAFVDTQSLQLNLGLFKKKRAAMPSVPEKWRQDGMGLWTVPATDVDELSSWLRNCLSAVSGSAAYRASGWIEGRTQTRDVYELQSWIGQTYTSYSFDEEWELIPGKWKFEVWHKGKKLCEQSFTVVPDAKPKDKK